MRKPIYAVLIILLFLGAGFFQKELNKERVQLGLTRLEPLENAPPLLTFTTVALGGFRGLIANALWIRAMTLQQEGKYFEMVQLADWITKLQPHYAQVWRYQAWNMAYNISVKFSEPADRWRWVQRGIELLRDEGLQYNPTDGALYQELAWHFQHKLGANLDEAHNYYKGAWVQAMKPIFGTGPLPQLDGLVNPATTEDQERRRLLIEHYKMDPDHLLQVEKKWGPLEWRLPEAHAIYWADLGLKKSTTGGLMHLRRVVYQSLKTMFDRGRLTWLDDEKDRFRLGPNLESFARVNEVYEELMKDSGEEGYKMRTGHKNFLKQAVEFLYVHNRREAAGQWYDYLKELYPDSIRPPDMPLDQFVVEQILEVAGTRNQVQVGALIEGMLANHFEQLAFGERSVAEGFEKIAREIHSSYQTRVQKMEKRIGLPPYEKIRSGVLDRMLDPGAGLPPALQSRLRFELNLPAPGSEESLPR